jgi:hypothetical protein
MKRTENEREGESDAAQQSSIGRRRFLQIGGSSPVFGNVSRAPVTILTRSLRFYFANPVTVIGLAFFSAIGRAIQLGWGDSISLLLYLLLGGIVWGSRIGIFLVAIGGGSLREGSATIRRIHKMSEQERETKAEPMETNFKNNWIDVVVGFVIFGVFVYLIPNVIISQIAETESVLRFVRNHGLQGLDDESLGTVIDFFLRNLTIIPFTIIWIFYGLSDFLRNHSGVPAR